MDGRIAPRGAVRVVSGTFDPLLAEHADELARFKQEGEELVVMVREPDAPLLSLRARMELVAALECVDWVAPAQELDDAYRARFLAHVIERQE